MTKQGFATFNTFSLLIAIATSVLAQSGIINGQTIGEVSTKFESIFTPPGYTFSIWGVIYFSLTAHVIFQWYALLTKRFDDFITQLSGWFITANLLSVLWIILWLHELPGLAALTIIALLMALIQIMSRLQLEVWDAPVRIIILVWWPFAIYLGWIIAATLANISSFTVSTGWDERLLTPEIWTIIVILLATAVFSLLIFKRNLRESAAVGIWTFVGIADKNQHHFPTVSLVSIVAAVILVIFILYHSYQNRHYNPLLKLKRGEF